MGMSAGIFALGPFRRDLVEHLPYPPELYARTREGTPVIRILFDCVSSSQSREMAACFGISDPWDFNQHSIDPAAADLERLRTVFPEDPLDAEIKAFRALREGGFAFYFWPNM